VPLGAAAVPVFAGLATQMTLTGVAAGTLGLAFHGIGDALKALNDYQIDPTDAHLKKLQQTMARVGPEGESFVEFLDSLGPQLTDLSSVARHGFFPGAEEGIKHLMGLLPQVKDIVGETSTALGNLASDAGKGLSGSRFTEFFDYIDTTARPMLVEMGHTIGNFVDGLAAMLVAFGPLSAEFSTGLEGMSKSFADWAHGLDSSTSFQHFVDYVRESGPKAIALLGSMVDALIGLAHAAAPIGDVMLPALTHFFNAVAQVADTPIGTMFLTAAAAASVYGRAVALASITTGGMFKTLTPGLRTMNEQWRTTPIPTIREFGNTLLHSMHSQDQLNTSFSTGAKKALESRNAVGQFARSMAPTAAAVGLLGASVTGLDKKMGLTNTTTLGLMGLMIGPWGAALGVGAGAVLDLKHANNELEDSIYATYLAAKSGDFDQYISGIHKLKAALDDATHTSSLGDFVSDTFKDVGYAIAHPGAFLPAKGRENRIASGIDTAETTADMTRAAASAQLLARGFEATAAGEDNAAQSAINFRNNIKTLNDALAGRASIRDYEQALDDFTQRAKDRAKILGELAVAQHDLATAKTPTERAAARARIKDLQDQANALKYTLDINTQAGRDTQALLDNIAKSALAMADTLDGVDRAAFLDNARAQFIKAARAAGMGKAAAKALADQVLGLDNVRGTPKIIIDANGAIRIINDVQRRLNQFKDKKIRLTVLTNIGHANAVRSQYQEWLADRGADGATVPKTSLPYADRWPYLLADGEEVVSDRYGGATKNRPALKAASRGATLAVIGYADGGTAGEPVRATGWTHAASAMVSAAPGIDYDRLAAAMSAVRPMYGDAHFHGDWTTWRRQMEDDRRATGLDRVPRGGR